MIDGVASRPFSATTLAPYPIPKDNFKAEITRKSEEKYGTEQIKVEEGIAEYFAKDKENKLVSEFVGQGTKSEDRGNEKRKEQRPADKTFEANCIVDGKRIFVSFEPDGRRPIYCQEHLELLRAGKLDKPERIVPDRASVGGVFEKRINSSYARPLPPPQIKREFVSRHVEAVKPISLKELPKKENKEINLFELRAILEESIKNKEIEKNPEPQVYVKSEERDLGKKMSGVIRPGESVKF